MKVVLVTGASSGIGLALVKRLRAGDYRVVATAPDRSVDKLASEGIADDECCMVRPLDVTEASQREEVVGEVDNKWGGVDILINNAGISYRAVIEHSSEAEDLLQFRTNFFGPMALIRLVLPHMREQRWGRIINISSVGGMMAMATMGAYSASKFALVTCPRRLSQLS